jgi:hydroxymethylbilane synthase
LETRAGDERIAEVCAALNHPNTWHSVLAERAFLRGLGGGCQSAVAAWARVVGHQLHLRAGVFNLNTPWARDFKRVVREAVALGESAAAAAPKGN